MTVIYKDNELLDVEEGYHVLLVPLNSKSSTLGYMKSYRKKYPDRYLKYKSLTKTNKLILGESIIVENAIYTALKRKQTDKVLYQHLLKGLERLYDIIVEKDISDVHVCIKDLLFDTDREVINKYIEQVFGDDILKNIYVYEK